MSAAALFTTVAMATSAPAGGTSTEVIAALSGIDFLPGAETLNALVDGDLTTLADVANGTGDPGVRVRAYRSLGQFDDDRARQGLKQGIDRYRSATVGTDLLYLMAAAEGLGMIGGSADVPNLGPLLDAASRDLRVVVARALGQIGDNTACDLLRRRSAVEPEEQVHIELDLALASCTP
ncbi:MAG TPA: HEAT repeat domain-containing protein [Kofleriaceae bacterium]|nr:HEAT repeat domain-containing protein [Kofleriaceae bacterium]